MDHNIERVEGRVGDLRSGTREEVRIHTRALKSVRGVYPHPRHIGSRAAREQSQKYFSYHYGAHEDQEQHHSFREKTHGMVGRYHGQAKDANAASVEEQYISAPE